VRGRAVVSRINVSDKIVIFPKATAFISHSGYSVTVVGRRQCDIVLLKYLVELEMKHEEIPDVAIYSPKTREWRCHRVTSEETLDFAAGRNGDYTYYPLLMTPDNINLLMGFITAYSGNTLVVEKYSNSNNHLIAQMN
jgi:hypothetical protein